MPVELSSAKTAGFTTIARQPACMTVHEILYKFEIAAPVRRGCARDLGLQQAGGDTVFGRHDLCPSFLKPPTRDDPADPAGRSQWECS